jgi:alkylated DNA repair protein alkB family protein 8
LHHEFITEEEEQEIINDVLSNEKMKGIKKRLSLHYGHLFDYTTFAASETEYEPVPSYLTNMLPRLPVQEYLPDQFTIQYYPPGVGIPPHVDTHSAFYEALYSLSLGSAVPMAFKKCGPTEARRIRNQKRSLAGDPSKSETSSTPEQQQEAQASEPEEEQWEVLLPARSLLVMTGDSRYGYTHHIRGRKTDQIDGQVVRRSDRYSITMRTIKKKGERDCQCDFPDVCDARIMNEQNGP